MSGPDLGSVMLFQIRIEKKILGGGVILFCINSIFRDCFVATLKYSVLEGRYQQFVSNIKIYLSSFYQAIYVS